AWQIHRNTQASPPFLPVLFPNFHFPYTPSPLYPYIPLYLYTSIPLYLYTFYTSIPLYLYTHIPIHLYTYIHLNPHTNIPFLYVFRRQQLYLPGMFTPN